MSTVTDTPAPVRAIRRRRHGRLLRSSTIGAAAAATVALSQVPVAGAFSGVTGNADSSASTAATFCTAAPTTLTSSGDAWTDESNPDINHYADLELRVRSSSTGDRHVWTRFTLPTVPARCDLVHAELRVYNKTPVSGRNVDVYRGDPTAGIWTSTGITWNTAPANPLGPAATNAATTSTPGWQNWDVTGHVLAQYTDGDNGFVLRDREVHAAAIAEQVYYDLQNSTYGPRMVLTWG